MFKLPKGELQQFAAFSDGKNGTRLVFIIDGIVWMSRFPFKKVSKLLPKHP